MENNRRLVMVDSCVFLEIILQQILAPECEERIRIIKDRGDKICVSMEILYEIMTGIQEAIDNEITTMNPSLEHYARTMRLDLFKGHIATLKKLLNEGTVVAISENFQRIRDQCNDLRVDNHIRGDRDKTNIATAIDNKCVEFVTKDGHINDDREKIKRYSEGLLRINFIR